MQFEFRAPVWLHPGDAAWHFITLPAEAAEEIEGHTGPPRRGSGRSASPCGSGAPSGALRSSPTARQDRSRQPYLVQELMRGGDERAESGVATELGQCGLTGGGVVCVNRRSAWMRFEPSLPYDNLPRSQLDG